MISDWNTLYRLQDRVISQMNKVEHEFYLSGGTAISRGYYGHRYSEDLDFFVNNSHCFTQWRDQCLDALSQVSSEEKWCLETVISEDRFGQSFVHCDSMSLKLEFINDVQARVGRPRHHLTLGLLDTEENILANKITALIGREEPKDMADVYWLCCVDVLDIAAGLRNAAAKAADDFPPLIVRELKKWRDIGIPDVVWIQRPVESHFVRGLCRLIDAVEAIQHWDERL